MIIVDFEFTGLDNFLNDNNEIISMSWYDIENNTSGFEYFGTNQKITITAKNITGITPEMLKDKPKFSKDFFEKITKDKKEIYGFGVSTDKEMLRKYGIHNLNIIDIQDQARLKGYEKDMIIHGSSLETTYEIITNKKFEKLHNEDNEVKAIYEMYTILKDKKGNDYLFYMPRGKFAGRDLEDLVYNERKFCDGYRYNNNDLLSYSINYAITCLEEDDDFYY